MFTAVTERQKSILLTIIQRELSGEGFYTIQELTDIYGLRSQNSIQEHVIALRKKGYLEANVKGKSRGVVASRELLRQTAERGRMLVPSVNLKNASIEDLIALRLQIEAECGSRNLNLRGLQTRSYNYSGESLYHNKVALLPKDSTTSEGGKQYREAREVAGIDEAECSALDFV